MSDASCDGKVEWANCCQPLQMASHILLLTCGFREGRELGHGVKD